MKYKVGDKVRIQSKEWYESHKNKFGKIWTVCLSGEGTICFDQDNAKYCGKEVTIFSVEPDNYVLRGIPYEWTDEMIEGLAEEENASNANSITRDTVDKLAIKHDEEFPSGSQYEWECPQGYQFIDENGNVINATKIVLEKKKKEYPKTYEECCKVLGYDDRETYCIFHTGADERLFEALYRLKVCRDAYLQIAGEENKGNIDYVICNVGGKIISTNIPNSAYNHILIFPTEEMRDAFYENFKEEIKTVKELL